MNKISWRNTSPTISFMLTDKNIGNQQSLMTLLWWPLLKHMTHAHSQCCGSHIVNSRNPGACLWTLSPYSRRITNRQSMNYKVASFNGTEIVLNSNSLTIMTRHMSGLTSISTTSTKVVEQQFYGSLSHEWPRSQHGCIHYFISEHTTWT